MATCGIESNAPRFFAWGAQNFGSGCPIWRSRGVQTCPLPPEILREPFRGRFEESKAAATRGRPQSPPPLRQLSTHALRELLYITQYRVRQPRRRLAFLDGGVDLDHVFTVLDYVDTALEREVVDRQKRPQVRPVFERPGARREQQRREPGLGGRRRLEPGQRQAESP